MLEFRYRTTVPSDFYFDIPPGQDKILGEVTVSTSIGIPKDLTKNKKVRCDIIVVVFNKVTDEKDIKIKTKSFFDIVSDVTDIETDTLVKEAAEYCVPISLEETDKIILRASEALIGQQINLQLSSRFEEDE